MRHLRAVVGAVLPLAFGCEGDASLEDRPCPCSSGYTCCELTNRCTDDSSRCVLSVTPTGARVRVGGTLKFRATLPVSWSADGGTIDAGGVYHAPLRPGVYQVRASTASGATLAESVAVGLTELAHLIGNKGGPGDADGAGREARFSNATSITGDETHLYVSDGVTMPPPVTDQVGCAFQCDWPSDRDACVQAYAGPYPSPVGVRRISRSTGEVRWLVREEPLPVLAMNQEGLFAVAQRWQGKYFPPGGPIDSPGAHCYFEVAAHEIVRIDTSTGVRTPIAGTDSPGAPKDGQGASARLIGVRGMVASANNLYVTDTQSSKATALRQVDLITGQVTTLVANAAWGGQALAQAELGSLGAIAIREGLLYVVDEGKHVKAPDGKDARVIWTFDSSTGVLGQQLTTLEARGLCLRGSGQQEALVIDGHCVASTAFGFGVASGACTFGDYYEAGFADGKDGLFAGPSGLWCSGDGDVYFADGLTVRKAEVVPPKYALPPALTTVAGDPAHPGPETATAPGPQMRISAPNQVGAEESGALIFREGSNLVRVAVDGAVTVHALTDGWGATGPLVVGAGGALYFGTGGGVIRVQAEQLFDQKLPISQAHSIVTSSFVEGMAHDGEGGIYAWVQQSSAEPCFVIRVRADSNAPQTVAEVPPYAPASNDLAQRGCGITALVAGGPGTAFLATEPDGLVRIDVSSGKTVVLPTAAEDWIVSSMAYDPAGVLYVAEASQQRIRGLVVDTGQVFFVAGQEGSRGVQLGALPASLNNPVDIALLPDGSLAITDHDENVVLVAR